MKHETGAHAGLSLVKNTWGPFKRKTINIKPNLRSINSRDKNLISMHSILQFYSARRVKKSQTFFNQQGRSDTPLRNNFISHVESK